MLGTSYLEVKMENNKKSFYRVFNSLALLLSCSLALLLPAHAARRVVSLMPSYTEIIFALGAGPELAGVSSFCNWPPGAREIEKVGDYLRPNLEKIYSLKPDLVFAGTWQGATLVRNLREAGVQVIELPQESSIADIFRTINRIAVELGRKKEAAALIKKMKRSLKSRPPGSARPSVYIEVDEGGWTAGGKSFLSDAVEKAGGKNIFAREPKNYFQASWEAVVKKDPDAVILVGGSKEGFLKRPLASKLKAAVKGRIFTGLDRDAFSRPGPRLMGEIEKLKNWFSSNE